jgi:hypothetical protein
MMSQIPLHRHLVCQGERVEGLAHFNFEMSLMYTQFACSLFFELKLLSPLTWTSLLVYSDASFVIEFVDPVYDKATLYLTVTA